jgi:hypothetical protein
MSALICYLLNDFFRVPRPPLLLICEAEQPWYLMALADGLDFTFDTMPHTTFARYYFPQKKKFHYASLPLFHYRCHAGRFTLLTKYAIRLSFSQLLHHTASR